MPLAYQTIVDEALRLPGVVESSSYGTPALKVVNKLMIRLKEDAETIILRSTWEDTERLMAIDRAAFYITDHYRGHPWVLLRLKRAGLPGFRSTLHAAWRLCASKALLKANPELAQSVICK